MRIPPPPCRSRSFLSVRERCVGRARGPYFQNRHCNQLPRASFEIVMPKKTQTMAIDNEQLVRLIHYDFCLDTGWKRLTTLTTRRNRLRHD